MVTFPSEVGHTERVYLDRLLYILGECTFDCCTERMMTFSILMPDFLMALLVEQI